MKIPVAKKWETYIGVTTIFTKNLCFYVCGALPLRYGIEYGLTHPTKAAYMLQSTNSHQRVTPSTNSLQLYQVSVAKFLQSNATSAVF